MSAQAALLRALAEVVLYGDIEELAPRAVGLALGQEYLDTAAEQPVDEALWAKILVAEVLLRLANGHALPREVGLRQDVSEVHNLLGIDPSNHGNYEP